MMTKTLTILYDLFLWITSLLFYITAVCGKSKKCSTLVAVRLPTGLAGTGIQTHGLLIMSLHPLPLDQYYEHSRYDCNLHTTYSRN